MCFWRGLTHRTYYTKIPLMDYSDKHAKLLDIQDKQPPHLTIRQMGEALDIDSTSYIRYILDRLIEQGLVQKIQVGKKHVYRMLRPSYRHNEGKAE